MIKKLFLMIIAAVMLSFLFARCGKKEKDQTGELTQREGAQDNQSVETIKPEPINYDSMLVVVSHLVEAIKNNPMDIELRKELVAASYDTTWDTILAAGYGKPAENAETESIAMKYAEQAATVDAYRWAAYIKHWYSNPNVPDIGTLNAEIQGSRVVAKQVLPDQHVWVLVAVKKSNIPY